MEIDLGDVVARFDLRVKRLHFGVRFHIGAPVRMGEAERLALPKVGNATLAQSELRKVAALMDLLDDNKVSLAMEWTDDVGNAVSAPPDATAAYTTDNPSVLALTDNGDGTGEIAATGTLGVANVHLEATSGGNTYTGDLAVNIVTSMAARINIVPGVPEHV